MQHVITIAAEITVTVEAPSRAQAARQVRRLSKRCDLWGTFNEAAANRGEPAEGLFDNVIRVIGAIA